MRSEKHLKLKAKNDKLWVSSSWEVYAYHACFSYSDLLSIHLLSTSKRLRHQGKKGKYTDHGTLRGGNQVRIFRYGYHLIKIAEVGVEVHAIESENIKKASDYMENSELTF